MHPIYIIIESTRLAISRRNFTAELAAHKLVRLVFNGHVLQPDTKTLTACGLFDNCVVHCLIHNPRPGTASSPNQPTDNPPVQSINEGTLYAFEL